VPGATLSNVALYGAADTVCGADPAIEIWMPAATVPAGNGVDVVATLTMTFYMIDTFQKKKTARRGLWE
jgi:hypothetical protein